MNKNISPAMQRYAAEVYRLQSDYPHATMSMIAEHVGASLQAVSRMIRRMEKLKLVHREPYKGVRLTNLGVRIALPAIRRHRLAEVFLVKVMEFGWDEAHELTDGFELGIDQRLEDRIDALTGHPTRCPHGEPIPTKDGDMPIIEDSSLVTMEPGTLGHVSRVRTHEGDKLRYLADVGLIPGNGFKVLSKSPFNGPIRMLIDNREYVIGHELATIIWVEALDGDFDLNQCNRAGCPLPKATEFYRRLPSN